MQRKELLRTCIHYYMFIKTSNNFRQFTGQGIEKNDDARFTVEAGNRQNSAGCKNEVSHL